jgi:hypothetical protein
MPNAKKGVARARKSRKEREHLLTMHQLVLALGGATHIEKQLGTKNEVFEWYEGNQVRRGWGLQVMLTLLGKGYRLAQINPRLFGWRSWARCTIPEPKWGPL